MQLFFALDCPEREKSRRPRTPRKKPRASKFLQLYLPPLAPAPPVDQAPKLDQEELRALPKNPPWLPPHWVGAAVRASLETALRMDDAFLWQQARRIEAMRGRTGSEDAGDFWAEAVRQYSAGFCKYSDEHMARGLNPLQMGRSRVIAKMRNGSLAGYAAAGKSRKRVHAVSLDDESAGHEIIADERATMNFEGHDARARAAALIERIAAKQKSPLRDAALTILKATVSGRVSSRTSRPDARAYYNGQAREARAVLEYIRREAAFLGDI